MGKATLMALEAIYRGYLAGGLSAAAEAPDRSAPAQFYLALLAYGAGERAEALRYTQAAAARDPASPLYTAAASYLARTLPGADASVYSAPEAYAAFIRGGGNLGLYAATSAALRAAQLSNRARSLLDIGVGDGMALLPALTNEIEQLDLVEPSAALLASTCQQLDAHGRQYRAFNGTLQDFVAQNTGSWDIAEATFSLQSIVPEERAPLLAWLRAHCRRLLIAEFDVPDYAEQFAPARATYVSERFAQGVAEYADDGGLVAQGFLMPVMFGSFDRTAARTNYEQPMAAWAEQLRAAGFARVTTTELYPYWWAPACLLEAD